MFIRTPYYPSPTAIKERGTRKRNLSTAVVSAVMIVAGLAGSIRAQEKANTVIILGDDVGWFRISTYNSGMLGMKPRILAGSPGSASSLPIGTHHESMFHEMEVRPHVYLGSSRKLVFGRLRTFEEFPPMQEVASWSTDRIMTKMINQGRNGNRVPATASHHLLPGEALLSSASSGAPREMSDRQAATNIV